MLHFKIPQILGNLGLVILSPEPHQNQILEVVVLVFFHILPEGSIAGNGNLMLLRNQLITNIFQTIHHRHIQMRSKFSELIAPVVNQAGWRQD